MEVVKKDVHFIRQQDLDGSDKMNYDGVERICTENVQQLLDQYVVNSRGTQLYLKIIRYVTESFLNENLQPLQRLQKIWFAVFICRMWRSWLLQTENCSLTKNFITRNSYIGIELNAHALTLLLYNNGIVNNENFLPHLYSSQPCEQFFRTLRSMSTTLSTVVNFSILDVLYRLGRINLQEDLNNDLPSKAIKLPRLGKNVSHTKVAMNPSMPTKEDIKSTIVIAEHEALLTGLEYGLSVETTYQAFRNNHQNEDVDFDEDLLLEESAEQSGENFESIEEYQDDLRLLESINYLNLKHLGVVEENETIDSNSHLIAVKVGDKQPVVVRKSSLVWLLRRDNKRISSDRLHRFKN